MTKKEEIQKKKDKLNTLFLRTERLDKMVDRSYTRCMTLNYKLAHGHELLNDKLPSGVYNINLYFDCIRHIWHHRRMKEIEEEFRKEDEHKTNDK